MLDIKKKLGDVRLIVVAIGSYISIYIAILLARFIDELLPQNWALASCEQDNCYWLSTTFDLLISFSLTGFLFGMCLWLLYEKSAKQLVKFIPLFGLPALYIWWNLSLQAFHLSLGQAVPAGLALDRVIQSLTNSWGLSYFVILPLSVFAMILLMEMYSYKQIARTALLVVVVLAVSHFSYTLTPQYQEEQLAKKANLEKVQQLTEELQRAVRQLERTREGY